MPEHLAWRWPVDRLVRRGVARLEEIRRSWSINDVLNYNELLDLEEESEMRVAETQAASMKAKV